MVRRLGSLLALALVMPLRDLAAHPLHTSFTEIARDGSGRIIVAIRVFADDFNDAVTRFAGSAASGDSARAVLASRYLDQVFRLLAGDRSPVQLTWCGPRTEGNQVSICAMSTGAVRGPVRVHNAIMVDSFADQVNIVRWRTSSSVKTIVLTRRSPESLLE